MRPGNGIDTLDIDKNGRCGCEIDGRMPRRLVLTSLSPRPYLLVPGGSPEGAEE